MATTELQPRQSNLASAPARARSQIRLLVQYVLMTPGEADQVISLLAALVADGGNPGVDLTSGPHRALIDHPDQDRDGGTPACA